MAGDAATAASSFPFRLLTLALVLTTVTIAWLGWIIFDQRRDAKMFQGESLRIEELRSVIVHLDEVLTMSARMAAATGDLKWEERYRHFEPQLDAAIKETLRLEISPSSVKTTARTDVANIKLVEMENRAFALVHAGRKEEAQTVLFSAEYETQKQIYAEGIMSFASQIRREADEHERQDKRTDFLSMIGALVVLAISFAAWLSVVRGLQRWRANLEQAVSERGQAQQALRRANDELEALVAARTAELGKTNQALQAEITGRKRIEEVQRTSEARFSTVFRASPLSIAISRLKDGAFVDVNGAWEKVTGFTREETIGRKGVELKLWVDAGQRERLVRNMRERGPIQGFEVQIRQKSGAVRAMLILAEQFDFAGEPCMLTTAMDITDRKQIEEELQRQKTDLRVLFDWMPAMVWFKDTENRILRVNKRAAEIAGKPVEEIEGKPSLEIFPQEAAKYYSDDLEVIHSGAPKLGIVETLRNREGKELRVQTDKVPVSNKDGKVVGIVVMAQDITERKRTEEALRQSEEQFRAMFELASVGIAQADPYTGQWLRVNKKICEITGYSIGELLQMHVRDITHPEDWQSDWEAFQRVVRGEAPDYRMEKRYIRKDGALAWVNVNMTVIRDAAGQPKRTVAAIEDITERRRAAEALRESQQIIREIINAIPVRVFWKDKNLVYLGCNAIFARDAGFADPKDIIGKDDFQMGWRNQAEKYRADDRQIIESGCSKLFIEEPQTTPEGNTITLLSSKMPLRSSQGEISGLLGTYMDITGRKRLEAQLLQSQKMETVGKLAGGIAHEFNSILTTIIGHAEFLLNDLPAESPLANNATEISKAAGRAAMLTRQLLAYGRKQFLQPETLDLNQVITDMEGVFQHLMGKDVDTRIVPAPGLQAVRADAGQIEQVIMNLAINARDAMPGGGKLTLETANVSFDQDSVGRFPELKPGDYVMLAITDTGTGMSAEVKAHAFEPFFSTKGVGQGAGLGLSTCYGIVKQSGGHITVYSEFGRGTTFKIYLPQVEPAPKISLPRLDSPDLQRGTETILLVEDDSALREMAATMLRRLGYTVLAAADGIEALSLKQQRDNGHIDLLFTDVVMPHMSGKELADRVRALYPHIRILFTSAYTENAIVHQGVLNQGVKLLQKPFTPSALARKLREVLDEPPPLAGKEETGVQSRKATKEEVKT